VRAVRQLRGDVRGVPGDEEEAGGGGKQEVEARRCARVGTRRSPVGEEDDRGGARWAGPPPGWPACCCWAAQGRGGPGKSLLPFISVFYFFLTFVWFNKNTKPFYFIMPIFAGANGIILGLL